MTKCLTLILAVSFLACGKKSNDKAIVGKWDIYHYDAEGLSPDKRNFEPGEWTYEFTNDGKLRTFTSSDPNGTYIVDYHIKNNIELWIDDKGIQIPYKIKKLTSTELILEDENEVISMKKQR